MAEAYSGMMTKEAEEKYSKFYQNYSDPEIGTVSGGRGYKKTVDWLREENAALGNGWDPTRIGDYRLMRSFSADCAGSWNLFRELNNPVLDAYEAKMNTLATMNPAGKRFADQESFDVYIASYHEAIEDLAAESKKPEVQAAIREGFSQYKQKMDLDNPNLSQDEAAKRKQSVKKIEDTLANQLLKEDSKATAVAGAIGRNTNLKSRVIKGDAAMAETERNRLNAIADRVRDGRQKYAQYFAQNDYSPQIKPGDAQTEYAWEALDGRLELGIKVNKISLESNESWFLVRTGEQPNEDASLSYDNAVNRAPEESLQNVMGGHASGSSMTLNGYTISRIAPKGSEKEAETYLKETAKVMHESADVIRNMKSDAQDPAQKEAFAHGTARIAKWMDDYASTVVEGDGQLTKAIGRSATLGAMLVRGGSIPIMSHGEDNIKGANLAQRKAIYQKNIAEAIRVLTQSDMKNGVNIFDDYMDIMDSSNFTLKTEYRRQKMEQTGWDLNKESIYRNELWTNNEKIINAFERLQKLDDHGQYNKVLNNPISELLGSKSSVDRDICTQVGHMKGGKPGRGIGIPFQ